MSVPISKLHELNKPCDLISIPINIAKIVGIPFITLHICGSIRVPIVYDSPKFWQGGVVRYRSFS